LINESTTEIPSTTTLPPQSGTNKYNNLKGTQANQRETEVEISCRTLETDEDSLRNLFERLHQHIYENGYLKRFTSLRIENSALANIDGSDLFSGVSFQSLDLFQNIDLDVVSLKSFEASKKTLKTLLLQGSPFKGSLEFFEELSEFKRLETLILSNNHITGLPAEVFGKHELPNLSYVDLGGNRITTIGPKTFYKLPKLQRITLDNNFITNVTNETFILEREDSKLLLIFLRNNNLTEDSFEAGSFANMNQTVFLYLNNNQMTFLREDVFKPIFEEKNDLFIALWSNPFVCDCRSLWLLDDKVYLRKRLHGLKCTNFNKREVWDIEPQELKCT
jgi:Leucine-rich repeat (LRR) protein